MARAKKELAPESHANRCPKSAGVVEDDNPGLVCECTLIRAVVNDVLNDMQINVHRMLTEDSDPSVSRRSPEWNQGIFDAKGGWAVYNGTTLSMVQLKVAKANSLTRSQNV